MAALPNDRSRIRRHAALIAALAVALLAAMAPRAVAQESPPQLIDSLEEFQQRMDGLIRDRLKSVVPSGNFVLRLFVLGKNVEVPVTKREVGANELPGFRRGDGGGPRVQEKFQIDSVNVRIIVNENVAAAEQEYIKTIVPLLAELRPERGDSLDLQIVPPTEKTVDGKPVPSLKLDSKDWLILGVLGAIVLLLLIVMLRVMMSPRQRAAAPAPAPAPAPLPASHAGPSKEDEEAAQEREFGRQLDNLRHGVVKGLFARGDLGAQLVQAWQDEPDKVGGLIHALGPAISRQALLPHLDRERYQALEEAVRQESPPSTESLIELMREANLYLLTQDLAHPEEIRSDPFGFLEKLSRGQVGHLIKDEPVRVKAIALSRIDPRDTARILESLPKDVQLEVAVQIGNFQSMPLDMAENVARDLAVKARNLPDAKTVDIEGTKKLVDLMGRASFDTSRYLLDAIKAKDTQLSEQVERLFFTFEAIPHVPPEVLPQVIRALPSAVVVRALQGADPESQRRVIMAFPEQARAGMVTTLRASEFDEESVLEARQEIIGGFQSLAEQGKIDLKQISDAWQAQAKAS